MARKMAKAVAATHTRKRWMDSLKRLGKHIGFPRKINMNRNILKNRQTLEVFLGKTKETKVFLGGELFLMKRKIALRQRQLSSLINSTGLFSHIEKKRFSVRSMCLWKRLRSLEGTVFLH